MRNIGLASAKSGRNDEFYTQLDDIQLELKNYTDKFKGKVIFCNCDDPFESNFVKYFLMNFNRLELKELIATGYKTSTFGGLEFGSKNHPYVLRVKSTKKYLVGTQKDLDIAGCKYFLETEGANIMSPLIGNYALDEEGNKLQITEKETVIDEKTGKKKTQTIKQDLYYEAGDFRSDMSLKLLEESDIVATNPPFSLFREFMATLINYEKQFLIIGNVNAITGKEIFPFIKSNKLWFGPSIISGDRKFYVPNSYSLEASNCGIDNSGKKYIRVKGVRWYTNIDHPKRHMMLPLDLGYTYKGHEEMYPKYDNYDARKKALKAAASNGLIFKSEKVKEYLLGDWIQTYVSSVGFKITGKACMLLIEFLGNDLGKIVNELDKLAILLEKGTSINEIHIEENIGISKDYNTFELTIQNCQLLQS